MNAGISSILAVLAAVASVGIRRENFIRQCGGGKHSKVDSQQKWRRQMRRTHPHGY